VEEIDATIEEAKPDHSKTLLRLFQAECRFVAGAAFASQLPHNDLPEVAFVGRSNVGKSSLINALTFRKSLARVSISPGRTRQINFFNLGDRLTLVDLPGYGYAAVSKQDLNAWKKLITYYIQSRSALRKVILLVDCRHPLKQSDEGAMRFFQGSAIPFQIVLTKVDKESPNTQLLQSLEKMTRIFSFCHPHMIHTSAKSKLGMEELRLSIAESIGIL
jgi:GTP-binding protein